MTANCAAATLALIDSPSRVTFGGAEVLVCRRHAVLFVLTTTRHFAAPHEAVCRKLPPMKLHDDSPHRFSLCLKESQV